MRRRPDAVRKEAIYFADAFLIETSVSLATSARMASSFLAVAMKARQLVHSRPQQEIMAFLSCSSYTNIYLN